MRYLLAFLLASALLLVICFFTGALSIKSIEPAFFTTTINATTESIRFAKPPSREASWTLPPGQVSVLGPASSDACSSDGFEATCDVADNMRLIVVCGAEVTIQSVPDGGWSLTVVGSERADADIRVEGADGREIAKTADYLAYRTRHAGVVRIPFVAGFVQVGEPLRERRSLENSAFDFWQPVLREGRVQMSADNKPDREKYQVVDETLDGGDVLQVGNNGLAASGVPCNVEARAAPAGDTAVGDSDEARAPYDLVWGMLTFMPSRSLVAMSALAEGTAAATGVREPVPDAFAIVLHTSVNELRVTRFGAPAGHEIKASSWTVLQKRPNMQLAWVTFVSFVVFVTFVFEIAGLFKEKDYESAKHTQPAGHTTPDAHTDPETPTQSETPPD